VPPEAHTYASKHYRKESPQVWLEQTSMKIHKRGWEETYRLSIVNYFINVALVGVLVKTGGRDHGDIDPK
jgi:hypothetical protein